VRIGTILIGAAEQRIRDRGRTGLVKNAGADVR
jgi:hypothetical protein